MTSSAIQTRSLWINTIPKQSFHPLERSISADVCVIGGGVAGLTTAYLLAREGVQVVVVTKDSLGDGEIGRTTAHLASALDDGFQRLVELHGKDATRLAIESHEVAIRTIESIARQEQIDCDFEWVDGYLFLGEEQTKEDLEKEYGWAVQAGMTDARLLEKIPVDFWDSGPAIQFARQAQFHPMKYLTGLSRAILRMGGAIYTDTPVTGVTEEDDTEQSCTVTTERGRTITAHAVAVCTNTPINDWVTMHTKQAAYRSYVIGCTIPRGSVLHALYWDTSDPYHYIRVQPGQADTDADDILIVGGEDHKTGQAEDTDDRFRKIEAWTRARFPMVKKVQYQWSGQLMEPVDGLAFLGRNPGNQNIYISTGDSGHGITHGTLAGLIIADLVAGRQNPWVPLYDPARITMRAAGAFLKENLNVAGQFADWVTSGEVQTVEQIPRGSGAVMRKGAKKVAVYKDDQGQIHTCSAVCPHLYCIVDWNDTEKSWDCPCHGSRFDAYGKVINGPAVADLSPEVGDESD